MLRYRREIDGLRAVAVVPVMLFHAGFGAFAGGFVGVDVFFVISGYLITSIILAEREAGTFTLAGFYERRARRILPALVLVMLTCAAVAWAWLLPADMIAFSEYIVAASLMVSNLLFWWKTGYFGDAAELTPLLHTWSLSVEEQYYVLFPVVLLLLLRAPRRWILPLVALAAVASLVTAQWATKHQPAAAFYLLPTRAWELLTGVALALHAANRVAAPPSRLRDELGGWCGLALIAIAVAVFGRHTAFPGFNALLPVVGTALVIQCAGPHTTAGRMLSTPVLVGLGLVSYSAYLWHQPLLAFARYRSASEPPLEMMGALCALAFVLAYGTWRLVERPARDRSRVRAPVVLSLCAGGTLVAVGFGAAGIATGGYQGRVPEEVHAMRALSAQHLRTIFETGCDSATAELPRCTGGSAGAQPTVALWGDSHAAILVPELERAMAARGRAFVRYTKKGCPAALGLKSDDNNGCEWFTQAAFNDLRDRGFDIVVVASRWQFFAEREGFDNGEGGVDRQRAWVADVADSFDMDPAVLKRHVLERFTTSILDLVRTGKRVVLVYPIPEAGWDVPSVLARRLWFEGPKAPDLTTSYQRFRERSAAAARALDAVGEYPNLIRVRPDESLCNGSTPARCRVQRDGVPLYFDDDHLTGLGTRPIVDGIARAIDP